MSNNAPFFSVLLPTYNRAGLVADAVRSVLRQTFADFELVISDSASTDNTKEIIENFADGRIKYFNPGRRLTMGENYDYALGRATGEYIIFFSDDDAFIPGMLERIHRAVEQTGTKMLVFPFAIYAHEGLQESFGEIKKNSLAFTSFDGSLTKVSAADEINYLFARHGLVRRMENASDANRVHPLVGNVVLRRSVIEDLKKPGRELFSAIPVDLYFITLVLENISGFHFLNQPLLVWSQWASNSSVYIMKGRKLHEHYEKLLNGKTLECVPLKFPLPLNCAANAVLQARRDLTAAPTPMEIDWGRYFVQMYEYLIYIQSEGVDVKNELEELFAALATRSPETREYFRKKTTLSYLRFRQNLKIFLPYVAQPLKLLLYKYRKLTRPAENVDEIILGETAKFNGFLEAAEYLDRMIVEREH